MSADNTIIILKTEPKEYYYEYRVKMESMSSADHWFYDEKNSEKKIQSAREIFKDAPVFDDFKKALKCAEDIMNESVIVEYGISEFYIDKVF